MSALAAIGDRFDAATLDFLRLATGAELPMAMFQSGRIRISGDLFFAAQLQGMFELPTVRG